MLAAYRSARDVLIPEQDHHGPDWLWDDDYADQRARAGLLLDLLGYFPGEETVRELESALRFTDPLPRFYAAASLLRLGEPVADGVLAELARSDEVRARLFDLLAERQELDRLPAEYRTQPALAQSEMVSWLIFPTELGRVPDEIELMDVIAVPDEDGPGLLDYFVYRFRTLPPDSGASAGWMAGIAGPYHRHDEPTTESLGETFSRFESWESKTPREHLEAIVGPLEPAERAGSVPRKPQV